LGGFRLAALCRVGDGVGDGLVTAGAVEVAVVPCCWVQEATNAIPITALIKHNKYLFIACEFEFEPRRTFGCLKGSRRMSSESSSNWMALRRRLWAHEPSHGIHLSIDVVHPDLPVWDLLDVVIGAKVRAIYLRDALLDPWRTGEGLCRDASEEVLCRVESAHR
jgi:hypothetical protein